MSHQEKVKIFKTNIRDTILAKNVTGNILHTEFYVLIITFNVIKLCVFIVMCFVISSFSYTLHLHIPRTSLLTANTSSSSCLIHLVSPPHTFYFVCGVWERELWMYITFTETLILKVRKISIFGVPFLTMLYDFKQNTCRSDLHSTSYKWTGICIL